MNTIEIELLTRRILEGGAISLDEARRLACTEHRQTLYDCANEIRRHFCGDVMDLCSITNAKSGRCSENCKWCSQSAYHTSRIDEYALVERKRAIDEAEQSARHGVRRHSLVASGKRVSAAEMGQFIEIYREIQKRCSLTLCASMGLLSKDALLRLKDAGVRRYHCNLETAPSFFAQVCTTHTMAEKISTIQDAMAIGLEVCSGGIIGMGETMDQRLELAFLLRDLGILSIPINILNPIAGTALEKALPLREDEVLTTFALFRFVNPKAYLRFAGGRLLIRTFQAKALNAGINASIVGDMLTTIGSGIEQDLIDFRDAGLRFYTDELA